MTQEIIEMARQAGVWTEADWVFADILNPKIEAFAKLIAEKEREACIKEVEVWGDLCPDAQFIANKLRARGQA